MKKKEVVIDITLLIPIIKRLFQLVESLANCYILTLLN
jgi:hypothetical protein